MLLINHECSGADFIIKEEAFYKDFNLRAVRL